MLMVVNVLLGTRPGVPQADASAEAPGVAGGNRVVRAAAEMWHGRRVGRRHAKWSWHPPYAPRGEARMPTPES